MKVTKYLSKYLRANDVSDEMVVTIDAVSEEKIGHGSDSDRKLVVYFQELDRGLVLTKTTVGQLVSILQSDDSDNWIGKRAVLFHDPDIYFKGKKTGGLRFKAPPEGQTPF